MADDNPFAVVARFMMPVIALTVGARLDAWNARYWRKCAS
jgi:hypothetical protein